MMKREHSMLPVWFFIGLLLLAYGVILLVTGIQEISRPPAVVLARYHAGLWGGIVLVLIGGFYTIKFWPRSMTKK